MTAMFRFVHCADVHFDKPFRTTSRSARQQLANSARDTFSDLVDLCISEQVHALLVAGDLFDGERLALRTEEFMLAQLERLTNAGITVVACSGNEDPGAPGLRAATMAWPERFHWIGSHEPREVVIHGEDGAPLARVVGAGLTGAHDRENLVSAFPHPSGPEPAVAMLHATVTDALGAQEHDTVAGCRTDQLADKGYRYWALGHVHRRQQVLDRPAAHYPGSLLSHNFGECGAMGALLVELPASGMPQVSFKPLARVRWETLELDELQTVADPAELAGVIADAWAGLRAGLDARADQHWMLRVALRGECPATAALADEDAIQDLAQQLDAADDELLAVEIMHDELTRPVDLAEHIGQPHALGLALEILDEAATDNDLLANLAPESLAGCPTGQPDERHAYLRALLQDTDRLTAQALLRENHR